MYSSLKVDHWLDTEENWLHLITVDSRGEWVVHDDDDVSPVTFYSDHDTDGVVFPSWRSFLIISLTTFCHAYSENSRLSILSRGAREKISLIDSIRQTDKAGHFHISLSNDDGHFIIHVFYIRI